MSKNSQALDGIIDMLMSCDLFNTFASEDLRTAAAYFNTSDVKSGEVIFREGDAGTFMCVLNRGKITISKTNSEGKSIEIATLMRGRAFGEMAVLDGERRSATCIAATECTLLTLTKVALDKMLQDEPRTAARVIVVLAISISRRLRMAAGKLVDQT